MQTVLNQMLARYNAVTLEDKKNALKEIVQEVILCGLSRAGFFKNVAFYGGTALRIFYGLDRFSEDLDFSLLEQNPKFDVTQYFSALENEVKSLGLNFDIEEKTKSVYSDVKSAFLKGNTKELMLNFYENSADANAVNAKEVIKIKFEIDTNPPAFASFENKYRLLPSPYQVRLYDAPSLFAGKIHAVICRAWKNRVKGRDLYDYIFYLSQGTKVNIEHLKARLLQSGFVGTGFVLSRETLIYILNKRFESIDFNQAKEDVIPFIKDKSKTELWSKEFFVEITKGIIV